MNRCRVRSSILVLAALLSAAALDASAERPVRSTHPRIWLTPEKLSKLVERARTGGREWKRLLRHLDNPDTWYRETTLAMSASLAYLCLEDSDPERARAYADLALRKVFKVIDRGVPRELDLYKVSVAGVAVTYDWLYELLSAGDKRRIIEFVNKAHDRMSGRYRQPWVNYNFDIMMISGISGYATYGDNPRAQELIDHARKYRWGFTKPALEFTGKGGGWVEENGYGMETASRLVRWMAAVKSATGEDLFRSIDFVHDRLLYEMLTLYPVPYRIYDRYYHAHVPSGDGRGGIGPWQYARIGRLAAIEGLTGTEYARFAQAWVSRPPADRMAEEWMAVWDFLFYNPDQDSLPLDQAPLACYAPGTGTVVMKGDWTPDGTLVYFQGGGPHLEYHQHLDKNSFVVFKRAPLAIDSGRYDGMGDREDHVVNYYKRTIAHNSILVYRPDENWTWKHTWQYKPGVNDGGQRAMTIYTSKGRRVGPWVPFNSTGLTQGDWPYEKFKMNFDCGSTPRFEHTAQYTYTMGDATKAYPAWRVSNFTRQLVYLRPAKRGGDEFIVVFDRVASADPAWKKYWLLHFLVEPDVLDGGSSKIENGIEEYEGATLVSVTRGGGRLFSKTVLPLGAKIRKIGGELTYDSWVFGRNHPYEDECCYGWGRIEVVPPVPAEEDLFLHVLFPTFDDRESMPRVDLVEGEDVVGVKVDGRICTFSRSERELEEGSFRVGGTGWYRFLLADLVPGGNFEVLRDGEPIYRGTSSRSSILSFETRLDGEHVVSFRATGEIAEGGGR